MAQAAPPAATQNTLCNDEWSVHEVLFLHDEPAGIRGLMQADAPARRQWLAANVAAPFAFNELIPSWNLSSPPGVAYRIELRVRPAGTDEWSPWFCFWGHAPLPGEASYAATTQYAAGEVRTDYLVAARPCDRLAVRVTAAGPGAQAFRIDRFAVCVSNTTGDKRLWAARRLKPKRVDRELVTRRLAVPFLTQHISDPDLVGNICSPTSVAMVLGYHGLRVTPAEMAREAFDPQARIYGNWPANVQAAYGRGVRGYVARFSTWEPVEALIAAGVPLVASIRDPQGRLGGPFRTTVGHLLVVCGFDADGGVLVNDPAGRDAASGQLRYDRAAFELAWLRSGGVAYVLDGRSDNAAPHR